MGALYMNTHIVSRTLLLTTKIVCSSVPQTDVDGHVDDVNDVSNTAVKRIAHVRASRPHFITKENPQRDPVF